MTSLQGLKICIVQVVIYAKGMAVFSSKSMTSSSLTIIGFIEWKIKFYLKTNKRTGTD